MNQFPILLKREFWEHRNTFVVLPLITAAFMIIMMVGLYLAVDVIGIDMHVTLDRHEDSTQVTLDSGEKGYEAKIDGDQVDEAFDVMFSKLSNLPTAERERSLNEILHGLGVPLLVILSIVIFFYLIGALYEDRKDRSILFWKSMPVSDISTILAKLVSALVLVPAVYLVCLASVQFTLLLVASLASVGHDVSVWVVLWEPSHLITRWFTLIAFVLFQAIWSLPFYGWIILVSAWANSVPLAWIVGIPVALGVVERIVSNDSLISEWFMHHTFSVAMVQEKELQLGDLIPRVTSLDTYVGLGVGLVFITGAIWLRGRGDEI